jgi:hypothetical protein
MFGASNCPDFMGPRDRERTDETAIFVHTQYPRNGESGFSNPVDILGQRGQ